MNRRHALIWLSNLLGAACAALVVLPGVGYVLAKVKRRPDAPANAQRVARLADLVPGQPREVVITGARRDAWTTYPEQVLGRVWLVRKTGPTVVGAEAQVVALTSVCPHLGCHIQYAAGTKEFVCPCHKGVFLLDGERASAAALGYANPAPRNMDSLECRLECDPSTQEWWVVVNYQEFVVGRADSVAKS